MRLIGRILCWLGFHKSIPEIYERYSCKGPMRYHIVTHVVYRCERCRKKLGVKHYE